MFRLPTRNVFDSYGDTLSFKRKEAAKRFVPSKVHFCINFNFLN